MNSGYTQSGEQTPRERDSESDPENRGSALLKAQKAGDRKPAKELERGAKRVKRVCSCKGPLFVEEMVTTTFWNSKFHGDTGKHVAQEHTFKKNSLT